MDKALPTNPDVVVVGAGTAGQAAARTLIDGGRSVVLLEAGAAPGGRCVTERESLGVPFDRGGSWLHSATANPLTPLAETAGFTLDKSGWFFGSVRIAGQPLDAEGLRAYDDYYGRMWAAVEEVGRSGRDSAAAEVLPDSLYRDTACHWIAMHISVDADRASAADIAAYVPAEGDWLVTEGLGSVIAHLGAGLPIRCDCPVTAIDWSGPGVRVETAQGTLEAPQVIVTVSTGVLAAERIAFTPGLPNRTLRAIEALPMGLLNKVGILFEPGHPDISDGFIADYHPGGEAFCTLMFRFAGSDLAVAFVAGRFAEALEAEGPGAATAFCLEGLRATFGTEITKRVRKTTETNWMSEPRTLGSYSAARPGRVSARGELGAPLAETGEERLLFAGEACIPPAYATVHGAHLSGIAAARRLLES